MDPNEALRQYILARAAAEEVAEPDRRDDESEALWEAVEAADTLFTWFSKGGFPPNWAEWMLEVGDR